MPTGSRCGGIWCSVGIRRAWKHPRELGAAEVVAFLNHLANKQVVAAGTQNQALNAISFLYTQVPGLEPGDLGEFLKASKRRRVQIINLASGRIFKVLGHDSDLRTSLVL
jgi:hypothetical protein